MALLAALDSAPYLQIAHLLSLAQGTVHTRDVTRIHNRDANSKQAASTLPYWDTVSHI